MKKLNATIALLFLISLNAIAQDTPTPTPEPAKADINRSRSNIKNQLTTNPTLTPTPEPAKANINRSRANIKGQNANAITILSVSYGMVEIASESKINNYLNNMQELKANIFTPIIKKEHFAIGLNIEAGYAFGSSTPTTSFPAKLDVSGQTSNALAWETSSANNTAMAISAGPAAVIVLSDKFSLKPSVNVGWMSLNQAGVKAVQSVLLGDNNYDFTLIDKPADKQSGLLIKPAIQVSYNITDRIGVFASVDYSMGSAQSAPISTFTAVKKGADKNYTIEQLQAGTFSKGQTESSEFKSTSFGFGVTFALSSQAAEANINRSRSNIKGK